MPKTVDNAGALNGAFSVVVLTDKRIYEDGAPAAVEEVEYYEIASGDTLSAIAKRFYGNGSLYPRIFEANREVIKDPDKIYVGQKIRIPK